MGEVIWRRPGWSAAPRHLASISHSDSRRGRRGYSAAYSFIDRQTSKQSQRRRLVSPVAPALFQSLTLKHCFILVSIKFKAAHSDSHCRSVWHAKGIRNHWFHCLAPFNRIKKKIVFCQSVLRRCEAVILINRSRFVVFRGKCYLSVPVVKWIKPLWLEGWFCLFFILRIQTQFAYLLMQANVSTRETRSNTWHFCSHPSKRNL